MNRVVLIDWNVTKAEEHIEWLRSAGYAAEFLTPKGTTDLRTFRKSPPDAFVIELSRIPSQGRAAAVALRQQKATRLVPIVFVEGKPEKVGRVRELLPDAVYTAWRQVGDALRQAIESPPANPRVPGTLDGYVGVPLPQKLGIRAGAVVALLGAPPGFEQKLGTLAENVRLRRQAQGRPDVILLFAKSRADLERRFPGAARTLADGGRLWIIWPKKASRTATDLTQAAVRAFGLRAGLVDYKICAIDKTSSGLLFARRSARSKSGA